MHTSTALVPLSFRISSHHLAALVRPIEMSVNILYQNIDMICNCHPQRSVFKKKKRASICTIIQGTISIIGNIAILLHA